MRLDVQIYDDKMVSQETYHDMRFETQRCINHFLSRIAPQLVEEYNVLNFIYDRNGEKSIFSLTVIVDQMSTLVGSDVIDNQFFVFKISSNNLKLLFEDNTINLLIKNYVYPTGSMDTTIAESYFDSVVSNLTSIVMLAMYPEYVPEEVKEEKFYISFIESLFQTLILMDKNNSYYKKYIKLINETNLGYYNRPIPILDAINKAYNSNNMDVVNMILSNIRNHDFPSKNKWNDYLLNHFQKTNVELVPILVEMLKYNELSL